jgi:hypothetical protein
MYGESPVVYAERGSWRTLWVVLGALAVGFALDAVLPGSGPHYLGWLLVLVLVGGVVGLGVRAQHRLTTLVLTRETLRAGAETLRLATLDAAALRSEEAGGAPLGARVLGGALGVPKGRQPLPLRLADGSAVIAATRDPAALRAALLGVLPD